MKITSFNPMIVTKNAEATIALFEELGFERRHTKENISATGASDIRMKDANGHHVDIVAGDVEYTMIRINVDDFDEAIEFFMSHGFRKPHHEEAKKTTDNKKCIDNHYIIMILWYISGGKLRSGNSP